MTLDERIAALDEFAKRHGWEAKSWTGTQREPGDGIALVGPTHGSVLRFESRDGLNVAVARMEQRLAEFAACGNDAYLIEKHSRWGMV